MYGGHITDDWDRRTNNTYLEVVIRPEIMTQMQLTLQPGFKSPDPAKFERAQYVAYIEEKLPPEQPAMFGLHPNAEIGYLTNLGETLFANTGPVVTFIDDYASYTFVVFKKTLKIELKG